MGDPAVIISSVSCDPGRLLCEQCWQAPDKYVVTSPILCPLRETWVQIHTMECHSALKRNEILIYATTRIKLENIMLSEISQTEKNKPCALPLVRDA